LKERAGWPRLNGQVRLIAILRYTLTGLVGRQGRDLTASQLAVFLICYLEERAQTFRGLSGQLNVSKPAIVRALDWLEQFGWYVVRWTRAIAVAFSSDTRRRGPAS
jgi:hypothetical protein